MSANKIVPQSTRPRNGHTEAFLEAFDIPTNDNRILIKTTRRFFLRNHLVPAGTIGKIVDLVCDGKLYLLDFGLPIVARIEPGSDLIQPVNLAHELAALQADVNEFEAGLTAFEAKVNELRQRMEGASDER